MPDPRTDKIAQEAARLIETGQVDDVENAIHRAARSLGFHHIPMPGPGRVRKHAQAKSMQALGEEAYLERRRAIWRSAEEMMTAIELAVPDAAVLLVGRAAEGHIDAGVEVHIRIYTRTPTAKIVASLVELGYDEPAFATADTRFGKLDQIRFVEDEADIVVTRCLPELLASSGTDLFTGQPITTLTLKDLQQVIADSFRAR